MNAGALAGVRVPDLADESAAFTGRILADLASEVILIEAPEGGRLRHRAPFLHGRPNPEHAFGHLYYNANKRSLVLDPTDSGRRADFERLIASADVLVHVEDLVPGCATVTRTVDAPLLIGPPGMSKSSDVDQLWIGRMNNHIGNLASVL